MKEETKIIKDLVYRLGADHPTSIQIIDPYYLETMSEERIKKLGFFKRIPKKWHMAVRLQVEDTEYGSINLCYIYAAADRNILIHIWMICITQEPTRRQPHWVVTLRVLM